jgi:hypothetical protein
MANTKFVVRLSNDRLITPGGLATVGALIEKTNLYKNLDKIITRTKNMPKIKNSDIIGAMVGINCQGKSGYAPVNEFMEDKDFFCGALGTKAIPSEETLRQRLDKISKPITPILIKSNVELLVSSGVEPSPCFENYIPLDIDVTVFDNSYQFQSKTWIISTLYQ